MKQLNFLSKSSSRSCGHSSVTLASTVGSPSVDRRSILLKLLSVLVLIFTFGIGQMWGAITTVTASGDYSDFSSGSLTKNGVTFSGFGGVYSSDLRVYKKTQISIEASTNITNIALTYTGTSNDGGGWAGSYTPNATSWTSPTANGEQARITQIVVKFLTAVTLNKNEGSANGAAKFDHEATAYATSSFTAVTRSNYNCTGYWTATSGGTKILNADGSLAAANITVNTIPYTDSNKKWVYAGSTLTLYAQWESTGCANKVNITAGDPESGASFSLDKTGQQNCCSALTVTVSSITAPTGKRFKAITQSGIAAGNVTINNNAKTVTYAANSSGSSTINVTFEDIPSHNINFHINGGSCATSTVSVREGDTYSTMPTVTGLTTNCEYGTFVGWTAATSIANGAKPTIVESVTMEDDDVDLYAVYSKTSTGSGSNGSIEITRLTTNFPTGYGTANTFTEYSLNDYNFKIQQVYNNNNATGTGAKTMQWRASGNSNGTGTIYNTETYPAHISSIVVVYANDDSNKNHTLKVGDSENPTSGTSITPTNSGNTYTFDCSEEEADYFVLTNGSGAGYLSSFTINYGSSSTTTYSLDANCCTPLASINGSFFWSTLLSPSAPINSGRTYYYVTTCFHRAIIVSRLTLYILCIYPVILDSFS